MNPIIENLLTRRTVRAFTQQPLPRDEVDQIVKAALYAPSAKGLQTWKFTVVMNQEKIQRLAQVIGEELNRTNYNMYLPKVLIIPSNEKDSPYGKEDNACALENIFLAAHSFGIGSVWINQLQTICDVPSIRRVLKEFEIPDNHEVYGMAALGYPAPVPPKKIVKTGQVLYIE